MLDPNWRSIEKVIVNIIHSSHRPAIVQYLDYSGSLHYLDQEILSNIQYAFNQLLYHEVALFPFLLSTHSPAKKVKKIRALIHSR